jgi:hypothetical protein
MAHPAFVSPYRAGSWCPLSIRPHTAVNQWAFSDFPDALLDGSLAWMEHRTLV